MSASRSILAGTVPTYQPNPVRREGGFNEAESAVTRALQRFYNPPTVRNQFGRGGVNTSGGLNPVAIATVAVAVLAVIFLATRKS